MKAITIQGVEFLAPSPYSVGHVLTDHEATTLNQTFAENLRNNFAGDVKKAKATHGDKLPSDVLDALRREFDEYAAGYRFNGTRRVGESDPVLAVAAKAPTLTEAQKMAICKSMGVEYKPTKKAA